MFINYYLINFRYLNFFALSWRTFEKLLYSMSYIFLSVFTKKLLQQWQVWSFDVILLTLIVVHDDAKCKGPNPNICVVHWFNVTSLLGRVPKLFQKSRNQEQSDLFTSTLGLQKYCDAAYRACTDHIDNIRFFSPDSKFAHKVPPKHNIYWYKQTWFYNVFDSLFQYL